MTRWGMATAQYGTKEHLEHMRNGYEPMAVIPFQQQSQFTKEIEVTFVVFLKKDVTNENAEPQGSDGSLISGTSQV